jgi:uncharacterized protein (DUF433 family)
MAIRSVHRRIVAVAELFDRITVNPAKCEGRPCVRGMRIRVVDVLDLLAAGLTQQQVLEELPDLEPQDIPAARSSTASGASSIFTDRESGRSAPSLLPK